MLRWFSIKADFPGLLSSGGYHKIYTHQGADVSTLVKSCMLHNPRSPPYVCPVGHEQVQEMQQGS